MPPLAQCLTWKAPKCKCGPSQPCLSVGFLWNVSEIENTHEFSSKAVVSGKNISPGSSLDEVCSSRISAMLDNVMCWRGFMVEVWPKAVGFELLDSPCFGCTASEHKGSKGELPTSSFSLPSQSPDTRQARVFSGYAHRTFLPLLGICTCIVQFCWQNTVSWFWRIHKACSRPALGPVNQVCLSASRVTGWSCISSPAEVFC